MNKNAGYHILRVGLGITFLWIGVLIFKDPTFWSGFLPPWIIELLPVEAGLFMLSIGVLDVVVGFLFLIDRYMWQTATVASLHLLGVLVTGVDVITVRDFGLLGGTIALLWADLPKHHRKRLVPESK